RTASRTACWTARTTPVRKPGAPRECRRCCSPATMPPSPGGAASRAWAGPGCGGPTCWPGPGWTPATGPCWRSSSPGGGRRTRPGAPSPSISRACGLYCAASHEPRTVSRASGTHVNNHQRRPIMSIHTLLQQFEAEQIKRELPKFGQGDTVIVNVKVKEGNRERVQAYEGVVIAVKNAGLNSSFTVRKISHGYGVERVFQSHSPSIVSVEVKRRGKVRAGKLYYLRGLEGKKARIKEDLSAQA